MKGGVNERGGGEGETEEGGVSKRGDPVTQPAWGWKGVGGRGSGWERGEVGCVGECIAGGRVYCGRVYCGREGLCIRIMYVPDSPNSSLRLMVCLASSSPTIITEGVRSMVLFCLNHAHVFLSFTAAG